MRLFPVAVLTLTACGSGVEDRADGVDGSDVPVEAVIARSEVHMLTSTEGAGQEFRVSVALPISYDASADTRYPVLYVLDADLAFGTAVEITRGLALGQELPELIIVGVGYPVESFVATLGLRSRDFTPTEDPVWMEESLAQSALAGMPPPVGTGGGPAFLRFLTDQLVAFVDDRYRTVPGDRGLFGDSLGGLFALYTLFHQPEAFRRYIVGSPSLWWDEEVTFQFADQFSLDHDDLVAAVYLGVGDLEEVGPVLEPFRMVSNTERMRDFLAAAGFDGLRLETKIFEGETHMSVPPMIFSRGVRSVYPVAAPSG